MSEKKVTILSAFKTIIWPRRKLVFIGLLLIVISKAASFVAPLSLKYLMDDIIPNKNVALLKKFSPVYLAETKCVVVLQILHLKLLW